MWTIFEIFKYELIFQIITTYYLRQIQTYIAFSTKKENMTKLKEMHYKTENFVEFTRQYHLELLQIKSCQIFQGQEDFSSLLNGFIFFSFSPRCVKVMLQDYSKSSKSIFQVFGMLWMYLPLFCSSWLLDCDQIHQQKNTATSFMLLTPGFGYCVCSMYSMQTEYQDLMWS